MVLMSTKLSKLTSSTLLFISQIMCGLGVAQYDILVCISLISEYEWHTLHARRIHVQQKKTEHITVVPIKQTYHIRERDC